MLSPTMLILGVALLAPAQCALLHLSRARGGPLPQPPSAAIRCGAHIAAWLMALLSAVALAVVDGLALALVLPLAALATAGVLYVPMVHAWPRTTLALSGAAALAGIVVLAAFALGR